MIPALFHSQSSYCIIAGLVSHVCKYVSHHSFGTVVDLNTNLSPNRQRVRNKNNIYDAVYNHLIYERIKTDESGVQYYRIKRLNAVFQLYARELAAEWLCKYIQEQHVRNCI